MKFEAIELRYSLPFALNSAVVASINRTARLGSSCLHMALDLAILNLESYEYFLFRYL